MILAVGEYRGIEDAGGLMAYAQARGEAEHERHAVSAYIAESIRCAAQGKYLRASAEEAMSLTITPRAKPTEIVSDLEARGAFRVVRKDEPARPADQDRRR